MAPRCVVVVGRTTAVRPSSSALRCIHLISDIPEQLPVVTT
jgi:hypothetical protein